MRLIRRLVILWAAVAAHLASVTPLAAADSAQRLLIFDATLSVQELNAAKRWGREWIAKGEAAAQPVVFRTVRVEGVVLISLQSVAVCDRWKGCPLLGFNGIDQPPVLLASSFENILAEERPAGLALTLRLRGEPDRQCLVRPAGRATCRPVAAKAKSKAPVRP